MPILRKPFNLFRIAARQMRRKVQFSARIKHWSARKEGAHVVLRISFNKKSITTCFPYLFYLTYHQEYCILNVIPCCTSFQYFARRNWYKYIHVITLFYTLTDHLQNWIIRINQIAPFHLNPFSTVKAAFQHSFNEQFWRHGIVISQGNGMSVSKEEAIRRLDSIRRHLGRKMFGNHWRNKAKIKFVLFQHGSTATDDGHYHALLGIEGDHDWSDFRIAMTIQSIERMRHWRRGADRHWEKPAHVDWNWEKSNRYHGYVSRFANIRPDDWDVIWSLKTNVHFPCIGERITER